jgi:hypothetical protein
VRAAADRDQPKLTRLQAAFSMRLGSRGEFHGAHGMMLARPARGATRLRAPGWIGACSEVPRGAFQLTNPCLAKSDRSPYPCPDRHAREYHYERPLQRSGVRIWIYPRKPLNPVRHGKRHGEQHGR